MKKLDIKKMVKEEIGKALREDEITETPIYKDIYAVMNSIIKVYGMTGLDSEDIQVLASGIAEHVLSEYE